MNGAPQKSLRIGIVGGMGPMAGVFFQQLIIERTPAARDQEHLEVVCFTNPAIPDRTNSLAQDSGEGYVRALTDSIRLVERAGADFIAIPCNAAHARFADLKQAASVPLINMVAETIFYLARQNPRASVVGLLGTDGLVRGRVYERFDTEHRFRWTAPSELNQRRIAAIIAAVKAGERVDIGDIASCVRELRRAGADTVLLACTELSLYEKAVRTAVSDVLIVDPLRILADAVVSRAMVPQARSERMPVVPSGAL